MSALIEVRDMKKYFKTQRGNLHAVDEVSYAIERGRTLGVVGESGCGKSTLGRVSIHLLEATSGSIFFEGKDISQLSRPELKRYRQDMQMIFQDPFSSLDPRMSVSNIIAEPLRIYRKHNSDVELSQQVGKLMDTVGLARRLSDSYPHELDGGRRQRVGVARALSLSPKFIVCDEPVSALDVSIQAQILNLMQDLQEEMNLTYLFITHNMAVVKHISDNILVMYMGKMVEYARLGRDIRRSSPSLHTGPSGRRSRPGPGRQETETSAEGRDNLTGQPQARLQVCEAMRARDRALLDHGSGSCRGQARTVRGLPPREDHQ